jgi:oligopeptide transport system ATP-binding protein
MGPAHMTNPQFGAGMLPAQEEKPEAVILQVQNLKKHFTMTSGLLQRTTGVIKAVDGVSFFIRERETLGMVGESGCGKTTTGRCILRLETPTSGEVIFQGRNLCQVSESEMRAIRQNIQVIFQDPFSSLNPRLTIEQLVGEAPRVFKLVKTNRERRERVASLLSTVGLNPSMAPRYPHELSGGQRQRVGIARALSMEARLIICDEPVSALDVSIQAQIINLLEELQEKFGLSYLFIAHDLSVVRHISHRIAVMYLGKIVEITGRHELYENPLHPYTKALLSAVPIPDPLVEAKRAPIILKGEVPSLLNPPSGCVFHPRCNVAVTECSREVPQLREISPNHYVSCLKC